MGQGQSDSGEEDVLVAVGKKDIGSKRCKLPFVVAEYTPDTSMKGKVLGMMHQGKFVRIVSKQPIRVYDDRDCLNQLDLSDENESSSEPSTKFRREKPSVSRTFYGEASGPSDTPKKT